MVHVVLNSETLLLYEVWFNSFYCTNGVLVKKRGERGEGEYGGKNIGSVKSVVLLILVI